MKAARLSLPFASALAALLAASTAHASIYTWTQTAGNAQSWEVNGNWSGGAWPTPVLGDTVDFSAVNIVANTTLTLQADRTAEDWKFGDTSSTQTWTVNTGNKMILAGTTPTIQVNDHTATLNNVVDGSAGLKKDGAGTLVLAGTNPFTGGVTINAGTLTYSANANMGASGSRSVTFTGSGTLNTTTSGTSLDQLTVNGGASARINTHNISFTSATGSGTIVYAPTTVGPTLNLNNASTFTGNLQNDGGSASNARPNIQFSSLGDTTGSFIRYAGGTGDSNQYQYFTLAGDAGPLTFSNRTIEFVAKPGNWSFKTAILQNNNGTLANKWVISTNLSNLTDRNHEFQLGGSNTGDNEFAGVIGNSTRGTYYSTEVGRLSLIKANGGKWILSNTNTYSGTTTISSGILNVISSAALGDSSATNTLIFNGGTLQAGGTVTSVASRGVTMTGTGLIDTNGNAVSIAGVISGAGGLTKSVGAGTLTLTGANTYAGTTTISTGTLAIGDGGTTGALSPSSVITNNATLAFNRSNTIVQGVDFGSAIGGGGAVTQAGTGTSILSGNNTYTGSTTVSAGTLIARHANALGTGGTRNVSVAAGAGLNYDAAADSPLSITGTLGITGGAGTVIGGSIGSTATGARIAVTGDATATGAIGVNIYGISGVTPVAGTNTYTLVQGGGTSTLDSATYTLGTVFNNTNFTVGALSKTTNTIDVDINAVSALSGNMYWKGGLAGVTNVWAASDGATASNWATDPAGTATALVPGSAADVVISTTAPSTVPTATVLGANMTIRSLTIADTTNGLGLTNDGNILTIANAAGITMNASVPASSIAARVALGASQTWTNNSNNNLTVSGVVSGAFGLTTAGTGTITLAGVNTYTGATTISAGTLNLTGSVASATTTVDGGTLLLNTPTTNGFASATTINNGGTLSLGGANKIVDTAVITVNGTGIFNLNGNAETIARTAGTGGSVTNTGALATLTLTGAGTQTISNVFGGALNLSIQGTSTITLTGSSNYTGSTTIGTNGVGGTKVLIGANNALPAGTTISISGTGDTIGLDLRGYSQALGPMTLNCNQNWATMEVTDSVGGGVLTLTGGAAAVTSGAGNSSLGKISVTTLDLNNATQTFTLNNNTLTVTSVIRNGALTKAGSKILALSGANTYAGSTLISGGTLQLDNKLALQNSPVDTSGAGVINANNGAGTYSLGGLSGSKNLASVVTTGLTNITTLNLNPQTGTSVSYSGIIAANGAMGLTKTGEGTQTLTTATHTYSGATTVSAGVLAIGGTGSINSSSSVTITGTGTLRYDSSTPLNKPVTFTSGTLAGTNWTGTLGGQTIGSGQKISPGNSPGTAATTSQTWAGGGTYKWEINNATGTAGLNSGWDLLAGTGNLDVTATSGSKFDIDITSLKLADNTAGAADNFNSAMTYNWLIADFDSITGFDATKFQFTDNFTNDTTGGTFGVALGDTPGVGGDSSQIYLTYIPEPSAAALLGLGGLALLRRRRR